MEWNYISEFDKTTGYEDILDVLKTQYTKEIYIKLSDSKKNKMINEVFEIYRNKNIFPIVYYNNNGIKNEIKKCIDKNILWDNNVLNFKYNQGLSLLRFLFPNLQKVDCRNVKHNNMIDRFYDDYKLKRAIKLTLEIKNNCSPVEIRRSLELINGNIASNFKPMNAKALYERYCPKNGVIYDFSCGFGGRMLGALTSKNNYTYTGVEPCVETYNNLIKLGSKIEEVTKTNSRYDVVLSGSEDYIGVPNSVDFAFSSPPYFNLEKYSDEPTQCYNKYSNIDDWFKYYVIPTIKNIYKMLKKDCYYAVNIADFKIGKDVIRFSDKWADISLNEGFYLHEIIDMKINSRRGQGNYTSDMMKKEKIYIFKK